MTDVLPLPNGTSVLIEHDMAVVPRCGSCFEPLFAEWAWRQVHVTADLMVRDFGKDREEVLASVVALIMESLDKHDHPYVIEEEAL